MDNNPLHTYRIRNKTYSIYNCIKPDISKHIEKYLDERYKANEKKLTRFDKASTQMEQSVNLKLAYKIIDNDTEEEVCVAYFMPCGYHKIYGIWYRQTNAKYFFMLVKFFVEVIKDIWIIRVAKVDNNGFEIIRHRNNIPTHSPFAIFNDFDYIDVYGEKVQEFLKKYNKVFKTVENG